MLNCLFQIGDAVHLPDGDRFIIETPAELFSVRQIFADWGPESTIEPLLRLRDLRYVGNGKFAYRPTVSTNA